MARSPHVLVVEDVLLAQKMARIILETLQCTVLVANSGKSALEYAHQYAFDLILMDLGLPDGDGFHLTPKVHDTDLNANTPIIALTAHLNIEIQTQCETAGMVGFLAKPLTLESAQHTINKHF